MSDNVYKTTEVVGSSAESVSQAISRAVEKSSETIRNVEWFEVVNIRGHVTDGSVGHYQVTVKIGFRLD